MYTVNYDAINALDIPESDKKSIRYQLKQQKDKEDADYNKEFNRYKQDCRKKALEWAEQEKYQWISKDGGKWQHFNFEVIELADKYYKWLISIPEN